MICARGTYRLLTNETSTCTKMYMCYHNIDATKSSWTCRHARVLKADPVKSTELHLIRFQSSQCLIRTKDIPCPRCSRLLSPSAEDVAYSYGCRNQTHSQAATCQMLNEDNVGVGGDEVGMS